MDKFKLSEKKELLELSSEELIRIRGGGLGPLWWNPMIRATLLRYNIVYFKEESMIA